MHVGKGICGSIIMSLDIPTGRQPMIHTGGGGGWGGERGDAADDLLIMQLHTSSFFLQSDRDSSTCQCAAETLKWKIHLEVPRELHWHSWSSLPPPRPPPPHMCMHIHTPLSPSSIHPFSLNYALWLFVSVFLQKLPGETRVEEPIACSQQIKKACVFFFLFPCDVFVGGNSLSCAAGQGWGSWLWGEREREREEARRISISPSLLHGKCPRSTEKDGDA